MTAQTNERMRSFDRWTYHRFPLAMGEKAWKHAAVGFDTATGKVVPMGTDAAVIYIGIAAETVDATDAEKMLNVNLGMEIEVEYFAQTGDIAADDLGKLARFVDDQTVALAGTGPVCGRIWDVSATLGVGVQKLQYVPPAGP